MVAVFQAAASADSACRPNRVPIGQFGFVRLIYLDFNHGMMPFIWPLEKR